ncbi:D-alanyl-D-alanine carboxypeptidase [Streptomyces sp. NPDC001380]|uniref:D-alanyl-D-alanine carboxypeptidase n=1 Tax=Streptomyces sp. NPDC001380 TaxID=3364566 RepID=UPI0036B2066C
MGESPGTVERDEERRRADPDGESPGGSAEGGASPAADARDGAGAEQQADGGTAVRAESTVQLRVRGTDSPTTMLRLPADSPTRTLRLPAGATAVPDREEPAEGTEPAEGAARGATTGAGAAAADDAGAGTGTAGGTAVPDDPRLALRADGAPSRAGRSSGAATAKGGTGKAGFGKAGFGKAGAGKDEEAGAGAEAPEEAGKAERRVGSAVVTADPETGTEEAGTEAGAEAEVEEGRTGTGTEAGAAGTADRPGTPAGRKAAAGAEADGGTPAPGDAPGTGDAPVTEVPLPKVPQAAATGTTPAGTTPTGTTPTGTAATAAAGATAAGAVPAGATAAGAAPAPAAGSAPSAPVSGASASSAVRPVSRPVTRPQPHPVSPSGPGQGPDAEPEPPRTPETTSEAMEVLASLSARPMTPLRRAVRRITVWSVFLAFVLAVVCVVQLLRPLPGPEVRSTGPASYAFPGSRPDLPWPTDGQAVAEVYGLGGLGGSGAAAPAPMASVTKVMTAYVVLQDHPLKPGEDGPVLTADKQAVSDYSKGVTEGESVVKVTEGQKISEYEALQMLLIPSANNIARLLGRWDAGSQEAFVQRMNDTAKRLGMTRTVYTDPSGLEASTKSTAADQLKLAERVMQDDVFRQVVSTQNVVLSDGQRIFNNNQLLATGDHVIGVKTGSSTPAGGCLMWAAEKQVGGTTQLIIGVVMGQQGAGILQKALDVSGGIIAAAQKSLTDHTVLRKGDVVGYVDDGLGGRVPAVVSRDVTVVGWSGLKVGIGLDPVGSLPHTAGAGTRVGTVTVGSGQGEVKVPVVLRDALAPPSIGSRLTRLL